MPADRRIVVATVLGVAAVLYAAAAGGLLGYDTAYQLVWARDLTEGRLPQYELRLAPTPHPLQVLVAVPLALLGQAADEALRVVHLLAFGALVAGVARLGTLVFSSPVGLLAGAVVLTRPHLAEMAQLGDSAIPAAALIVWAGAAALGRRPRAALVLLALAGLLRPEAWLLAGAYALWSARAGGRRAELLALAVAGPALWVLSDLAVTGDALWSLHHTREGTELLNRSTGVAAGVEQLPRHLNFLLGAPVLVAAVLGLCAGLVLLRRRTLPLAAAIALAGGGFLALAVAGLSLQPRYLAPLAAGLALCAALAALGWTVEAGDRRRRAAGLAVLALLGAGLVADAREHADVRARLVAWDGGLEELVRGRALPACAPVGVPTVRPIPYLALWTGARPGDFLEVGDRPLTATTVTPTQAGASYLGGGGEDNPPRVVVAEAPGRELVAASPGWRISSSC